VTVLNYDKMAGEYARHRRAYPGMVEHIVDYAKIGPESTVLEVGCGTANHVAGVQAATGARCYGVDPSREMLDVAATQPATLDLRQGTAEELDFPAETFDLVLSVDVIHYVREPRRYFARAFELLKPGGYLLTATDSEWVIRNRTPMAQYFPGTIDVEMARMHPIPALTDALTEVGFREPYEHLIESEYPVTDAKRFEDKSFSSLHLISDEEFASGLARLKADLAKGPITGILRSTALWARRPA
jgi:ubiquinone/menaquinone biosynthesis C-methylase UbiE